MNDPVRIGDLCECGHRAFDHYPWTHEPPRACGRCGSKTKPAEQRVGHRRKGLPPKIPESPTGLLRAVVLLGARVACRTLTEKVRDELVALVGEYPSGEEEAAVWKTALKELSGWEKEEREEAGD